MINYRTTHFISKPYLFSSTTQIPILKHYMCVVCVDNVYVLCRGEKRVVKRCLKAVQRTDIVLFIDRFDCVWNVLCNSNAIVQLVVIKIYNKHVLHDIVHAELDRVVNFYQAWFS